MKKKKKIAIKFCMKITWPADKIKSSFLQDLLYSLQHLKKKL